MKDIHANMPIVVHFFARLQVLGSSGISGEGFCDRGIGGEMGGDESTVSGFSFKVRLFV